MSALEVPESGWIVAGVYVPAALEVLEAVLLAVSTVGLGGLVVWEVLEPPVLMVAVPTVDSARVGVDAVDGAA
jgi:hypothetical protein